MITEELKEERKRMYDEMERKLMEGRSPEDDMFYYHRSQDRVVLSHALFWVMAGSIKGRIAKEKYFLLLRQYQEELLDAFLQEDDYFEELLRYCNILYNALPMIFKALYDFKTDKVARKLAAMYVVAGGYGGDMDEDLANEILDDMDYHYNKVKCRKIEGMMPALNEMVRREMGG